MKYKRLTFAILLSTLSMGITAQTRAHPAAQPASVPAPQTNPVLLDMISVLDALLRPGCHLFAPPCTASKLTLEANGVLRFHQANDSQRVAMDTDMELAKLDPDLVREYDGGVVVLRSRDQSMAFKTKLFKEEVPQDRPLSSVVYFDVSPDKQADVIKTFISIIKLAQGAPGSVQSDQSTAPTLDETRDFLTGKISGVTVYSQGMITFKDGSQAKIRVWLTQKITFEGKESLKSPAGCTLVYNSHFKQQQYDDDSHRWELVSDEDTLPDYFPGVDFKLKSSKVSGWRTNSFFDPAIYQINMPVSADPALGILVQDQDVANRIQNALIGLGKLCGAKDEVY